MSDFLTWLAGCDEGRLTDLLRRRPDVLRGSAPPDLATVASRLRQEHSIADALIRQPRPALDVLSALILTGGTAPLDRLATTLDDVGTDSQRAAVLDWLRRLEDDGLAWVDSAGTAHTAPLVDTVLPVPTDWGQPAEALLRVIPKNALHPVLDAWGVPRPATKAAALTALLEAFADPVRLAAQIERLTPRQRSLLGQDGLAWSSSLADQRTYVELLEAQRAGLAAGLLLAPSAYSPRDAEAPAEVLRALRGRGLPFAPLPPPLPATPVDAALVERESAAALVQLEAASLSVLDHVRDRPVKLLQRGGIGTQEVTRVAKGSTVDAVVVRLVLDAACEAGLVEVDGPLLRWGDTTAVWRDLDAGPRVALLLEHWLRTPHAPTQTHDAVGRPLAVAAPERRCQACVDGRLAVLHEWARLSGAPHESDLAARVTWLRPLAHLAHREVVPVADSWDDGWASRRTSRAAEPAPLVPSEGTPDLGTVAVEARLWGLVGRGSGTALLRALMQGDRPAMVAHLDAMLPRATGTATFGSDLTAMVVGPPTGELSALLDSCGVRESRGGAVTWRLSPASVRRALDAGTTAAELTERVSRVAGSGLPQPLTYLLTDVARRHGRLRVAPARAVIRCDDQALLAEVVVDRRLRALALRQVAPTIAVSSVGDGETLAALRGAGYFPMPEAPDPPPGPVVPPASAADGVIELVRRRTPSGVRPGRPAHRPASPPVRTPASGPETPEAAAARLVGLSRAPGSVDLDPLITNLIRRSNRVLSDDEIDTLAAAVRGGEPVRIRYRSASSAVTDRVVSDLAISGHHVMGWCHLREDDRDFLIAGILSVAHA